MDVVIITIIITNNSFPFVLIKSPLDFNITSIQIILNCLFLIHDMYFITSFNYTYYNRLVMKHLVNSNFHMLINHTLNNIDSLNNSTSFTFILILFNFNLRFNLILINLEPLVFIKKYQLF